MAPKSPPAHSQNLQPILKRFSELIRTHCGTERYSYTSDNRDAIEKLLETHGKKLLENNNYPYNKGPLFTFLSKPASTLDPELFKFLIKKYKEYGLDVNVRDNMGNTPLHTIANVRTGLTHKFNILAKTLITHGADINATNISGKKPIEHLMNYALTSSTPHTPIIQLIDTLTPKKEITPKAPTLLFLLATSKVLNSYFAKFEPIAKHILKKTNVLARNNQGKTALDVAKEKVEGTRNTYKSNLQGLIKKLEKLKESKKTKQNQPKKPTHTNPESRAVAAYYGNSSEKNPQYPLARARFLAQKQRMGSIPPTLPPNNDATPKHTKEEIEALKRLMGSRHSSSPPPNPTNKGKSHSKERIELLINLLQQKDATRTGKRPRIRTLPSSDEQLPPKKRQRFRPTSPQQGNPQGGYGL